MILISSCLAGLNTRYDGSNRLNHHLASMVKSGKALCICPEQLAGLPTPRKPAEIEPGRTAKQVLEGDGKVFEDDGTDVTQIYVDAAKQTLRFCQDMGVTVAILKTKGPSCGSTQKFDGTFSGKLVEGNGLVAEILEQNGIKFYNEDNYHEFISL